ncbi:nitroreductase [Antricoccus suffuscus]|uniref:Nitroreductase n=1 Tax=Antricoccus suffuscus TaxID=1629062 RepID=A0A2T0ZTQ0_9ACTN|nr:nitroreductase family protein [Antricoccus suffuscus]PRZ39726.1 nitroreductase [Antricoccus suffuscus]
MTIDAPLSIPDISLLDGLATMRSVRRYRTDEDIPREILAKILFYATRAPNPGNAQNWRFLVLGREATAVRALLGETYREGWAEMRIHYGYDKLSPTDESPKARVARTMQTFVDRLEESPLLILACVDNVTPKSYMGGAPAIYPAIENLLLAARAYGYGGVLTTWHRRVEQQLRALLNVPDSAIIAATIPMGRPVGHFGPQRRRPLKNVVFDGIWGNVADWAVEPDGDLTNATAESAHS